MKPTIEELKKQYPDLGEIGLKITCEYINLSRQAIHLKLMEQAELDDIENRYLEMSNLFEKLQLQTADILNLLKEAFIDIKIPEDKLEFEEWKKNSKDYPKIICHDSFFDVFLSINEALREGLEQ